MPSYSDVSPSFLRSCELECYSVLTPLGKVGVAEFEGSICLLEFLDKPESWEKDYLKHIQCRWSLASHAVWKAENSQRSHWNTSWWTEWADFPLNLLLIGTAFQHSVWHALLDIPKGKVSTYKAIAENIGKPNAARAVGQAIGANPISLLVPCHRVVRSNGQLGGYRWSTPRKQRLLDFENAL